MGGFLPCFSNWLLGTHVAESERVNSGAYGLKRRSAVRTRRMRRLRAAAAIVALAVIWLGYSLARVVADRNHSHEAQTAAAPLEGGVARNFTPTLIKPAPVPTVSTPSPSADSPTTADVSGHDDNATSPGSFATSPYLASVGSISSNLSPQVAPKLQASLNASSGGVGHGTSHGTIGGGVPSMSGFGGGGGHASTPASDAAETPSGETGGSPRVLGHKFSNASDESVGGGTNAGANGSSGGDGGANGSNGSNDHNGDGNGNNGSSGANGSNDRNGDGNGNNGKNGNNGNDGNNGSNHNAGATGNNGPTGNDGSNGGSGSGSSEGGPNNAGGPGANDANGAGDGGGNPPADARLADVKDGSEDIRAVPEPGSILLAVGAAAVLVRRRRTR